MRLRFKKEYSDSEPRMAYELVSDEKVCHWDGFNGMTIDHYDVKLLGLIPCYKMEITNDETDQPAIDVFVNLSNK